MSRRKRHLSDILTVKPCMKIVIDNEVEENEKGDLLVNVGYLRVSTDRQAELGFGLDIQEKDIVGYCKYKEYKNLVLFIDDGYTGTTMERPALNEVIRLIQDYNEGISRVRVKTFVVARLDRLGRTLLGTLQFLQDYIIKKEDSKNSQINKNKEDIEFVSVGEEQCRFSKDNPQGKFLIMLFASLAEFDRDQIVQKLQRGRTARVASGKWIGGGNVPYGYRYNKQTSLLDVVPEEAEVVQEIFRLYIDEKMPPQKIAERFGFSGDVAVRQILKSKMRTGCLLYNGKEYPGTHEPIISLERWEEAQEEMKRRSVHRTASYYLLSGLVYCGECGAKMRYQNGGKQGLKLVCYTSQESSRKRFGTAESCDNVRLLSDQVEKGVIEELFRLNFLDENKDRNPANSLDPIEVLKKQYDKKRKQLSKLYDFEDEDEPDDVLREKIAATKRDMENLQKQIHDEDTRAALEKKISRAKEILRNLQSSWPHMDDKERQTILQELIDRVVIYKDGRIDVQLKLKYYLQTAKAASA